MGNLDEALSFQPFAPERTDLEVFRVIFQGLQARRAVKFQYKNLGAARFKQRLAHPYHLACIENRWYLFAFDVKRQAMRTFALTRLREPQLTGVSFERPKDFDLEEYLRGSFKVYKGSGDFEVVIEFDAWASDLARGHQWHATQQWTDLPGGGSRLRMRLGSVKEVEGWVLSWGAHATVVQPPALIQRIRTAAEELQRRYGERGTETPNPKPQYPMKPQAPNSKLQN
jgi:predicted DNA-binding transcriptional regulator YafY